MIFMRGLVQIFILIGKALVKKKKIFMRKGQGQTF
jgi:hypothetical protein